MIKWPSFGLTKTLFFFQTARTTAYSCILTAIAESTASIYTLRNRVPQGALVRLERYESKGSRTVLRGGDGGNAVLLPDISLRRHKLSEQLIATM